ncbi:GH35 family beta-galactosidase [Sphingomonas sp. 22176]|uniref:GH35 family beta-galactosidase n=1 Tax=Sphingomonas sp. 22176 TaxID=3453884 RepID=UPI003F87D789
MGVAGTLGLVGPCYAQDRRLPHLEQRGGATQLIVDGAPYLILGGETANSSTSDLTYMEPIWPRLKAMHLNTVLVPVAWETIEPDEGRFDWRNLDGLLEQARRNDMRLVLLWFGSWKNTFSSYVPAWVKRDQVRFARVKLSDGRGTERLTPFSAASRDADARAFAKLMGHLRAVDGERHTVLMVQVENEVGNIPQARDHSPAAERAFASPVPSTLMQYLAHNRTRLNRDLRSAWENAGGLMGGSWQQVFGSGSMTDSLFMAWHYATFVEAVTAAGKAQYKLPMFTNAALIRPNYEPGQYNSGGPLPHALDIWKAGAPSLDFLSPDIYFDDFGNWASQYTRPGNPLFVPEARGGPAGAANALYAFGSLHAIGFSPFGIDGAASPPAAGDASIGVGTGSVDDLAIAGLYARLAPLTPLLVQKQAEGKVSTIIMEGAAQRTGRLHIGDYIVNMVRAEGLEGQIDANSRVAAMFLQTGPYAFTVVGSGDAVITFTADTPGPATVGLESIDELVLHEGRLKRGRRLNGDENGQGQVLRLRRSDAAEGRVHEVKLYRYD